MKIILMMRYGFFKKSVSLFFILLIFLSRKNISANEFVPDYSYIDSLVASAFRQELYNDKYWHVLLHYKKGIFGLRSLIDDPAFFVAKNGKYDPKSELEATIRSFFKPVENERLHTICKFAARFDWLREKLNFDLTKLPITQCDPLQSAIEDMKPESASLIFPAFYMNNPASMFGHTLMIIEPENKNKLLSYAVNYSALTPETFGLFFAVKGIFGMYRGYFSVLPYYAKVQEYSNISQRDMWEYSLNLTKDEVIRMTKHLHELDNIYSDYYFFDENCSYNLFFLLDVARPSLNLSDSSDPWVIPVDTIRDAKKAGLIKEIFYRPSRSAKIKHIISLLSNKNKNIAKSILEKKTAPEEVMKYDIPDEEKINIFDLTREYLQFKLAKKDIKKEEYNGLFLKVSGIRSKLGNPDEDRYKIPVPADPLLGHKSGRLAIGAGYGKDGFFQEAKWRPAYHDLLDPDEGYLKGSQIQFCNIALKYLYNNKKLIISKLDAIDIFSLSSIDRFARPVSWRFNIGLTQKETNDKRDHLVFTLNGGGGYSIENNISGLCYFMAEPELNIDNKFKNYSAAGLGASAGIIKNIFFWKFHIYVKDVYYLIWDRHNELEINLSNNFRLSTNNSIRIELSGTKSYSDFKKQIGLYWNLFF